MLRVFSMIINNPEQFFISIYSFFNLTVQTNPEFDQNSIPDSESVQWRHWDLWIKRPQIPVGASKWVVLAHMKDNQSFSRPSHRLKYLLSEKQNFHLVGQIHDLATNCITDWIFGLNVFEHQNLFKCIFWSIPDRLWMNHSDLEREFTRKLPSWEMNLSQSPSPT